MEFTLNSLDSGIIIAYLVFIVLLGFYFSNKHKSAEDYFLAGRNLTWPIIGFSLFASNMSSNSLVGLAGAGYKDGFSVYSYEWMAVLILIVFAVFFLPFYLKNRIFTIPEYLERRFNSIIRSYASIIAIVLNIFVDIAATLYAGGLVINLIFPGFDLSTIIIGLALIAGLYTISGGLSAVMYTDAIQAVILILGSACITYFAFQQAGGWDPVAAVVDPGHFDVIKPIDDESLPWPAVFTGVFLIGFYFWGTNQYITQRTLASKNLKQGQWGSLFAGFLKLSILFIMIFPGAFARVLYPLQTVKEGGVNVIKALGPGDNLLAIDQIYPTMLFDLLPTGLLGVVLAGLIAAMMSSLDSGLNSVSTMITMDFIKKRMPQASSKKLMNIGRIVTFLVMIIAIVWAPQIGNFTKLWDYLQNTLAWFCPPIVALFVMGLFSQIANNKGAITGMIIGFIITLCLILNAVAGAPINLPNFLYVATWHFIICAVVIYLVSKMTGGEDRDLKEVTWSIENFHAESAELSALPFYKNYRYQAIALMVMVTIILWIY